MASASIAAVRLSPAPDRRLRLLALAAAPVLAVLTISYALAGGAQLTDLAPILIVAGSFLGTGFFAWFRRPENRIGPLMAGLGASFLLLLFGGPPIPLLAPLNLLGFTLQGTLLAYLILAFPSGMLGTTFNRALVAAVAILLGVSRLLVVLSEPMLAGPNHANPYLLIRHEAFVRAYAPVPLLIDVGILAGFIAIVIARWMRSSGPARRVFTPVALPTLVILVLIIIETVSNFTTAPVEVKRLLGEVAVIGRIAFPFGFLVGLMRMRMARSAVADLVVELGDAPAPERLRDALANALGDRTLAVAYWSPRSEAYVDAQGAPVICAERGLGSSRDAAGTERRTACRDPARRRAAERPGPRAVGGERDATRRRERTAPDRGRDPAGRGARVARPDRRSGRCRAQARRTRPA